MSPSLRLVDVVAAAVTVDAATAAILYASGRGGTRVREWYRTLRLGAFSMDVLSLVIATLVAALVAPASLPWQLATVVGVQLVHDLCFGAFVSSSHARGPLMKLFGAYGQEMGAWILLADAAMLMATVGLAHALRTLDTDRSALVGAVGAYVGLLVVYSF